MIHHDGSDIAKPWAKSEGLSMVHDGSTGELVNSYTFCMSVGCREEPLGHSSDQSNVAQSVR